MVSLLAAAQPGPGCGSMGDHTVLVLLELCQPRCPWAMFPNGRKAFSELFTGGWADGKLFWPPAMCMCAQLPWLSETPATVASFILPSPFQKAQQFLSHMDCELISWGLF